jgi:hypothetical protein
MATTGRDVSAIADSLGETSRICRAFATGGCTDASRERVASEVMPSGDQ